MGANVSVTGPNGGKINEDLFRYVLEAVDSFSTQLGINRFSYNVDIRLHERSTFKGDTAEGYIEPHDKRSFSIDVCLYGNWVSTLAHEMVHLKQYLRNEINWSLSVWKGKECDFDADYWNAPWEKEARKLQHKMVEAFEKI